MPPNTAGKCIPWAGMQQQPVPTCLLHQVLAHEACPACHQRPLLGAGCSAACSDHLAVARVRSRSVQLWGLAMADLLGALALVVGVLQSSVKSCLKSKVLKLRVQVGPVPGHLLGQVGPRGICSSRWQLQNKDALGSLASTEAAPTDAGLEKALERASQVACTHHHRDALPEGGEAAEPVSEN